jgi:hypothetical protein
VWVVAIEIEFPGTLPWTAVAKRQELLNMLYSVGCSPSDLFCTGLIKFCKWNRSGNTTGHKTIS